MCYLMSLESAQNCFGDRLYNDILIEAINGEITNARNKKNQSFNAYNKTRIQ